MTKRRYMEIAKQAGYTEEAANNLALLCEIPHLPYTTFAFVRKAEAERWKAERGAKSDKHSGIDSCDK